jgi:hypothetical protein
MKLLPSKTVDELQEAITKRINGIPTGRFIGGFLLGGEDSNNASKITEITLSKYFQLIYFLFSSNRGV